MAISVTPRAIEKIKAIHLAEPGFPKGLRFCVQGGGCSGFTYHVEWEIEKQPTDKEFNFDDLKVFVDPISMMYLDGCEIDYLETLEASGFKFNNPNVKNSCGCGHSFNV